MTVQYTDKSFLLLLLKWKGSVWKSVLPSYCVFMVTFYAINLSYRFAMTPAQQEYFEKLVVFFKNSHGFIPIQFLLGFYVSNVVSRWWQQIYCVAWPDKLLIKIAANIQGDDEETLKIRRTFARYCNLLNVLVWKEVSLEVKKRFPTDHYVLKSGLMTQTEYNTYFDTTSDQGRWFLPVSWMINLLQKCKESDRITDYAFQKLIDEIWDFRATSGTMTFYDWISIPIAYNQVVTVATYGFFILSLIGRQSLRSESPLAADIEWYFPIFTTLEFIFYVGWLKVGEELRVPFGEDDEDLNMTYILDRNLHVSFMLVDELNTQRFQPQKDIFWNESHPKLPHTKASERVAKTHLPPVWRLGKVTIKDEDTEIVDPKAQRPKTVHFATKVTTLPRLPTPIKLSPTNLQIENVLTEDINDKASLVDEETSFDTSSIKSSEKDSENETTP